MSTPQISHDDKPPIADAAIDPPVPGESVSSLRLLLLLRSAGAALLAQAALHSELVCIEWEQEKSRLMQLFLVSIIGVSALACLTLALEALLLVLSWNTTYRIPALLLLILTNGGAIWICWRRMQALAELGSQSFAATRRELAADISLIRSKL